MSDEVLLAQATDILQGTLQDLKVKKAFLTYAYTNYDLLNDIWNGRMKLGGGKNIERYITLGDEGNAAHRGRWAEDTHNVVNVQSTIKADWVTASSSLSYNVQEQDMNSGAAQIYDVIESKYDNCLRELADEMFESMISSPTSADDNLNPFGIPAWISFGGDNTTGGWTAYNGHYNDGSGTAITGGIGGIASSATAKARWANYYADHQGDIDDSLLVLLDRATRKLNFKGPMIPKALDDTGRGAGKFSLYSNDNVIGTINLMYAKADDQMGVRINQHFGIPYFKGMPFQYCAPLDTANTSTYGTDPIIGLNKELFYPVVHSNWDFKIGKPRQRDSQHLVMTVDMDVMYTYIAQNRQFCGFLVNEQ